MNKSNLKKKHASTRDSLTARMSSFGYRIEQSESSFLLVFLLLISAIYYTAIGSTTWISDNIISCTALIFAATGQTSTLR